MEIEITCPCDPIFKVLVVRSIIYSLLTIFTKSVSQQRRWGREEDRDQLRTQASQISPEMSGISGPHSGFSQLQCWGATLEQHLPPQLSLKGCLADENWLLNWFSARCIFETVRHKCFKLFHTGLYVISASVCGSNSHGLIIHCSAGNQCDKKPTVCMLAGGGGDLRCDDQTLSAWIFFFFLPKPQTAKAWL